MKNPAESDLGLSRAVHEGEMRKPQLFGADYSVYVRIARLVLHEKGVDYDLIPIDVFAEGGPPAAYFRHQPFGRIPAFEHDGFRLYETGAITRYIDEAFEGVPLQPSRPAMRARINQIVGIADAYLCPHLVWGLYVELVSKPRREEPGNEARIAAARAIAPVCLQALSDIMAGAPWLGGDALTLADLHAAPMIDYFLRVPEGRALFERHAGLTDWWERMKARPSMENTRPAG